MLLLFFISIFFIFLLKKKNNSIATYIMGIYVISLIGTFFLSPSRFFDQSIRFVSFVYLVVSLLLLILPWVRFKVSLVNSVSQSSFEYKLYKILILISTVTFCLNFVVFIFLQSVVSDINAFRYAGDSTYYFNLLPFPTVFVTVATIISSLSLFLLPYHFYYLIKGDFKRSLLSLILSCGYVLNGLNSFSRSTIVLYLLVYGVLFLYLRQLIPLKKNKKIILIGISLLIGLGLILNDITTQRFGGKNEWVGDMFLYNDSMIKNSTSNSLLSYLSQWYIYAIKWLNQYDGEMIYNRGTSIFWIFGDKYLNTEQTHMYLESLWYRKFGDDSNIFLGVSTNLLYNFGYFITFLILSIYIFIVRHIRNINLGISSLIYILTFSYFSIIGIFGSALNDFHYYVLLISCFLIVLFNPKKYIK